MGWLRKIGRKIDKGIRKVFGKDGWLKAAATVAALTFAAPIFGTGAMSFGSAVETVGVASGSMGSHLAGLAAKGSGGAGTVSSGTAAASTASTASTGWNSFTDTVGKFFMGDPDDKENPGFLANAQDFATDTVSGAIKSSITKAAMGGDTDDFGRFQGVQTIGANEQSAIQSGVAAYSMNYPNSTPTIAVPQVQPVFARLT